jgi:uncharacterized protein YecT (DUF1311 family)
MHTNFYAAFFVLWLLLPAFSSGQSQLQINLEAKQQYAAADKELNRVYKRILAEYKADQVFLAYLKTAQRLWIQWRDAEMKARYPDREAGHYGSIHPYCWNTYLTELTMDRTEKLSLWLKGIEEGDGCSGSVKANSY